MSWFDDYEDLDSVLSPDVPKGVYQLKVAEAEVAYWDDDRIRLDVSTRIVGGEHDDRFGPRKTYSFGGYSGVTKDGRDFEIEADDQEDAFVKSVIIMMNGKKPVLSGKGINADTLAQVARQLKGAQFIGRVITDASGYLQLRRVYPLSQPPASFKGPKTAAFAVDLSKV